MSYRQRGRHRLTPAIWVWRETGNFGPMTLVIRPLIARALIVLTCLVTGFTGAEPPIATVSPIAPHQIQDRNPFNGRHHYCAAFARVGLQRLTGLHFITFGSARNWARHVKERRALLPLSALWPGDLLFFRDQHQQINHVAIVIATSMPSPGSWTITFQDERGTHDWVFPESAEYLGMTPVFGANPKHLETSDSRC